MDAVASARHEAQRETVRAAPGEYRAVVLGNTPGGLLVSPPGGWFALRQRDSLGIGCRELPGRVQGPVVPIEVCLGDGVDGGRELFWRVVRGVEGQHARGARQLQPEEGDSRQHER